MRKLIFITIMCAFLAGPALASPTIKVYYDDSRFRGGGGGEFTAQLPGGYVAAGWTYDVLALYDADTKDQIHAPSFQTFCLEIDENLQENGHLYSVTISDSAVEGGVPGGSDPISVGTAYLYYKFGTHSLTGYNYDETDGTERQSDAIALQKAIWYLEEEKTWSEIGSSNDWIDFAATNLGMTHAELMDDNNGTYAVKAMNLTGSLRSQDLLVIVPVPAAVLLGMLGLGVAGLKLRKYA